MYIAELIDCFFLIYFFMCVIGERINRVMLNMFYLIDI